MLYIRLLTLTLTTLVYSVNLILFISKNDGKIPRMTIFSWFFNFLKNKSPSCVNLAPQKVFMSNHKCFFVFERCAMFLKEYFVTIFSIF
jgi:hypothetical protein